MKDILIVIHIVLCFVLVVVVLMQKGKGADIGAVFGGTSETIFGSTGAGSFLQKITVVIAAAFILTSLALSIFMSHPRKTSVMDNVKVPVTQTQQKQQKGSK
ncbi:MAG: preprotein translocase subunit SecG [Deltaproteobacteria bacterium]|nr:MAG: preprotein translocase subunit SecG [Deltaproteobacteria bacterium]